MLARMFDEFAPLMRLQDQMNNLFENFFDNSPALRSYGARYPNVNLWEEGDTAYVETELPGMNMDEIEIYVTGNEMTITGERKIESPQNASYQRRERATGRFSRMVTLPWEIDAEKVQAKLANGVLTITLPKSETSRPRRIEVKSLTA